MSSATPATPARHQAQIYDRYVLYSYSYTGTILIIRAQLLASRAAFRPAAANERASHTLLLLR